MLFSQLQVTVTSSGERDYANSIVQSSTTIRRSALLGPLLGPLQGPPQRLRGLGERLEIDNAVSMIRNAMMR